MFAISMEWNLTFKIPIRIAAAFIESGDRLISRIQYRNFAGNNISNVDHVTVRHQTSVIRDIQHAR